VQTFYDRGPVHVPFADPYCPRGRAVAVDRAAAAGWDVRARGTLVVVEGPRFSSRAESQWFAAAGWSVVGMTGCPEAALARELALCLTPLALVTDLDAGVEGGGSVTQAEVLQVFRDHTARLRALLLDVVAALPVERDCPCPRALDGLHPDPALP
jgi:5'-methylthioadenosine phosphorylase